MVRYHEALGDADRRYPNEPLVPGDPVGLHGTYVFGPAVNDRSIVSNSSRGDLVIERQGGSDQRLFHHGGRIFNPAGAEAVRIRFEPESGVVSGVEVVDGSLRVRGRESAG